MKIFGLHDMVESIACFTVGGLLLNIGLAYDEPVLAIVAGLVFALGIWFHG